MSNYATIDDVIKLFRPLTEAERERAEALLPVVSDRLRVEAANRRRNLDEMINEQPFLSTVAKSITVDVVARILMTPTSGAPMTQFSESAGGYTVSGTYLTPGGGIFIKEAELKALGLKRPRIGGVELYDDQRNNS